MDILSLTYIKYVAAGGNLAAASERKVAQQRVTANMQGQVVERMHQESANPDKRFHWSTLTELRGVFEVGVQDDIVSIMGGTNISEVYTLDHNVIREIALVDVRLGVIRPSDGLIVLKDYTNFHFMPELEEAWEQGAIFYLPFIIKSTDTSSYVSDNSAS